MKLETYCLASKRSDKIPAGMMHLNRIVVVAIGLILAGTCLRAQTSPGSPSQSSPPAQQQPQQQQPPAHSSRQQATIASRSTAAPPQEQRGTPAPLKIEDVAQPAPAAAPAVPPTAPTQPKSVVIEEVVARVNNEIITTSDLQHIARQLDGRCAPVLHGMHARADSSAY